MKQIKLEDRKSSRKHGLLGQRTASETPAVHYKATAMNKDGAFAIPMLRHIKRPHNPAGSTAKAIHESRQIVFKPSSILSQPAGDKMKIIPSHRYNPQAKAPSRRDRHRMEVKLRKQS